jgi:hypothetical protein
MGRQSAGGGNQMSRLLSCEKARGQNRSKSGWDLDEAGAGSCYIYLLTSVQAAAMRLA